jgi:hypothetical protein
MSPPVVGYTKPLKFSDFHPNNRMYTKIGFTAAIIAA